MRLTRFVGPVLLIAGTVCLVVGYLQGEASLSLFVIFPVITATGGWSALGILLVIAGFFAFFLSWPTWTATEPVAPTSPSTSQTGGGVVAAPNRRWGGVVFLGPVPVVFGSDAKIARWMILVGVLLFVGLLVLTIISIWGI